MGIDLAPHPTHVVSDPGKTVRVAPQRPIFWRNENGPVGCGKSPQCLAGGVGAEEVTAILAAGKYRCSILLAGRFGYLLSLSIDP